MKGKNNIFATDYTTEQQLRIQVKKQKPVLLWFTGLSGSGKSTLAQAVEKDLLREGYHTFVLDGDNVRMGLNKGLGFSEEDRSENLRRIGEVSKLMLEAGLIVIGTFVSPLLHQREKVREIVGASRFREIFINTPLEECEKRDVKGLYKKARAGEIPNFTGVDAKYEMPLNPDIEVFTTGKSVEDTSKELKNKLIPFINNG
ncbi:MAG: adenylyl-sulfate kinase [Nonlabens sp.]